MALTGRRDGPPLGPPDGFLEGLHRISDVLRAGSERLGHTVAPDVSRLLGERAAISGFRRNGRTSCGGATHLLPTRDGWIAVSLARADDVELLPAWLETDVAEDPPERWACVEREAAASSTAPLVRRATLLGLPVSGLPRTPPVPPRADPRLEPLPLHADKVADGPRVDDLDDVLVVDLSSLWAGPLCGSLLAQAGATVVKVESTQRPDGARAGPPQFFDLLNHDKRSVALDLTTPTGRAALHRLLGGADVVIEASRPRALEQLGVSAGELLREGTPRAWVSITAHGRTGSGRNRTGFGDDAAIAGGLAAWEADGPLFCADAVADPVTGLVAAAACLDALQVGGRWLLDLSLAGAAAQLAGPTLPVPDGVQASDPTARPAPRPAPALGTHTDEVLAEVEHDR